MKGEAGMAGCLWESSPYLSVFHEQVWLGQTGCDFNFCLFYVLYLPRVFLSFLYVTQKLGVVRPAGNGQEDDLFLHWSEITQERIIDKQSHFSKEWHSGSVSC